MEHEISTMQKIYDKIAEYLVTYGLQALVGLIFLFIGFKIAGWVSNLVTGLCQKKHLDITLTKFLAMLCKSVIIALAALVAMDKFGITISPILASISALIFGASFAIQAPLSNYAAGLSIILTRPFAVGNTITIKGYSGIVEDIQLPCTILKTGDGERITIPNKDIVGEIIVNSKENKMSQTVVGVGYGDDPEKAIKVIQRVLKSFPAIVTEPAPYVGIREFGDSAINIGVRYWAPTRQYVETLCDVNLAIFKGLKEAGISIPFPQRDLHIVSTPNGMGVSPLTQSSK
ncbi:MAG: mechanosensitive ion channel family protein [Candidatus Omnitrophota bacterium]